MSCTYNILIRIGLFIFLSFSLFSSSETLTASSEQQWNIRRQRRFRPSNVTVAAGERLVLRCPFAIDPPHPVHRFLWERAGVRLPYNHRQKAYENGTLEVHHVERATDEGPYDCVARNNQGQSSRSTIFVEIQVKPQIEPFQFPKALREGQRSSVHCTVSSGDFPIDIRWFKDGKPLRAAGLPGLRVSEGADYSSTLLFESLDLRHGGNYSCVATNHAGSVAHSATMVVHVPPRWTIEPVDSHVVKSRGLVIDCQAEGFPEPRVRWTKAEGSETPDDFRAVVSSPRLRVLENGSLAILGAEESDAGFYLCQATNGIGAGLSKLITLKVYVAAHFQSKFTAEMVRKGHDTRLKCEALGDLPVTVQWTKEKMPIKPATQSRYEVVEETAPDGRGVISELLVRSAERRDSALFSCLASNAYGSDDTNVQLIVQEKPDPPQDLRVAERNSRSVKLAWSSPYFTGNSPVSQYIVHYKDEGGKWQSRMNNITVAGNERSAVVAGLKPAKIYYFRVLAENGIGRSEPSKPLEVLTDEEAPGAPPVRVRAHATSAHSIKVSWKPPSSDMQYGVLRGYYVGYRIAGGPETFIYKTLEAVDEGSNEDDGVIREECHVTGLRRNTEYVVVVQAFNAKGAGPPSDEVSVRTLETDPPTSPPLEVLRRTTTTIQLSWDRRASGQNPVTGYVIHHLVEDDSGAGTAWKEIILPSERNTHIVEDLSCGSRHRFFLTAVNSAGRGQPSDVLRVSTEGKAPLMPDQTRHLLTINGNGSSAFLRLREIDDGGCPLLGVTVKAKSLSSPGSEWMTFTEGSPPKSSRLELTGLTPGSSYLLRLAARNAAGAVEKEYTFSATPPLTRTPSSEGLLPGQSSGDDYMSSLIFFELTTALPVAVSALVIAIVLTVVCLVLRKKHADDDASTRYGTYDGGGNGKNGKALGLTEMEKSKKRDSGSFCPQPYATTNLTPSRQDLETGYHQLQEEPLYATVKRTPRPPRPDGHIYHCPGSAKLANTGVMTQVKEEECLENQSVSGHSKRERDTKQARKS